MYIYQWWLVRIPVLLILPSIFYDIEIFFLLNAFLVVHLTTGLKAVLNDYLHYKNSKIALIILIRISSFEFLRYILEFII